MTSQDFVFVRPGRSPGTIALLVGLYAFLTAAVLLVDAAPWLMGLIALTSLPALRDVVTGSTAGMHLSDTALSWHSGRRRATMDLSAIDHVRLDRRWDMTVRAILVQPGGKRTRLPQESLPPHERLEQVLKARGIDVRRQPFGPF